MTCVCDRLYKSMFENIPSCNIISSKQEKRFEKYEVLNGLINDVSKSRKSHVFYQGRGDL